MDVVRGWPGIIQVVIVLFILANLASVYLTLSTLDSLVYRWAKYHSTRYKIATEIMLEATKKEK